MLRLAADVSARVVSRRRFAVLGVLLFLTASCCALAIVSVTLEGAVGEGCGSPVSPTYGSVLADRHCRQMTAKAAKGVPIYGGGAIVFCAGTFVAVARCKRVEHVGS